MKRRACLRLLALMALPLAASASARGVPTEVVGEIKDARLLGASALRWFGLHVYDARLWVAADHPATDPARADYARHPLALELQYSRALGGAQIAERSLEEMRRGGPIADAQAQRWLMAMKQCFPDVKAGDRITGVQRPDELTRFFVNGRQACELPDAEFTRRFFGIWLGRETSQPALRTALLGGAK